MSLLLDHVMMCSMKYNQHLMNSSVTLINMWILVLLLPGLKWAGIVWCGILAHHWPPRNHTTTL